MSQALELYDVYQTKVAACDKQIEAILKRLKKSATPLASKLLPPRHRSCQPNAPAFDARAALHAILGVDLTQIHGLGPYLALKLVGECGTSLTAWPTAKHFTSWLGLAPHNKISGGKGRWCTSLAAKEMIPAPSRYAMTRARRTECGRPASSIRFSTAMPMTASVC